MDKWAKKIATKVEEATLVCTQTLSGKELSRTNLSNIIEYRTSLRKATDSIDSSLKKILIDMVQLVEAKQNDEKKLTIVNRFVRMLEGLNLLLQGDNDDEVIAVDIYAPLLQPMIKQVLSFREKLSLEVLEQTGQLVRSMAMFTQHHPQMVVDLIVSLIERCKQREIRKHLVSAVLSLVCSSARFGQHETTVVVGGCSSSSLPSSTAYVDVIQGLVEQKDGIIVRMLVDTLGWMTEATVACPWTNEAVVEATQALIVLLGNPILSQNKQLNQSITNIIDPVVIIQSLDKPMNLVEIQKIFPYKEIPALELISLLLEPLHGSCPPFPFKRLDNFLKAATERLTEHRCSSSARFFDSYTRFVFKFSAGNEAAALSTSLSSAGVDLTNDFIAALVSWRCRLASSRLSNTAIPNSGDQRNTFLHFDSIEHLFQSSTALHSSCVKRSHVNTAHLPISCVKAAADGPVGVRKLQGTLRRLWDYKDIGISRADLCKALTVDAPIVSLQQGQFDQTTVVLKLQKESFYQDLSINIHFTTDGTEPNETSPIWHEQFGMGTDLGVVVLPTIDTIHIRAVAMHAHNCLLKSDPINKKISLPKLTAPVIAQDLARQQVVLKCDGVNSDQSDMYYTLSSSNTEEGEDTRNMTKYIKPIALTHIGLYSLVVQSRGVGCVSSEVVQTIIPNVGVEASIGRTLCEAQQFESVWNRSSIVKTFHQKWRAANEQYNRMQSVETTVQERVDKLDCDTSSPAAGVGGVVVLAAVGPSQSDLTTLHDLVNTRNTHRATHLKKLEDVSGVLKVLSSPRSDAEVRAGGALFACAEIVKQLSSRRRKRVAAVSIDSISDNQHHQHHHHHNQQQQKQQQQQQLSKDTVKMDDDTGNKPEDQSKMEVNSKNQQDVNHQIVVEEKQKQTEVDTDNNNNNNSNSNNSNNNNTNNNNNIINNNDEEDDLDLDVQSSPKRARVGINGEKKDSPVATSTSTSTSTSPAIISSISGADRDDFVTLWLERNNADDNQQLEEQQQRVLLGLGDAVQDLENQLDYHNHILQTKAMLESLQAADSQLRKEKFVRQDLRQKYMQALVTAGLLEDDVADINASPTLSDLRQALALSTVRVNTFKIQVQQLKTKSNREGTVFFPEHDILRTFTSKSQTAIALKSSPSTLSPSPMDVDNKRSLVNLRNASFEAVNNGQQDNGVDGCRKSASQHNGVHNSHPLKLSRVASC